MGQRHLRAVGEDALDRAVEDDDGRRVIAAPTRGESGDDSAAVEPVGVERERDGERAGRAPHVGGVGPQGERSARRAPRVRFVARGGLRVGEPHAVRRVGRRALDEGRERGERFVALALGPEHLGQVGRELVAVRREAQGRAQRPLLGGERAPRA